ncbi:MAG TPA: HupE/UreJ family protein [Candidatus Binatia bacterium]|nr:HupE/UreJ family protein [Candidatus Binatia bacterium]
MIARVLVVLLAWCSIAGAHSFEPALLDLREVAPGVFDVVWKSSTPQGAADPLGGLTPVLPPHCHTVPLGPTDEGTPEPTHFFRADCGPTGLGGGRLAIDGLAGSSLDVLVRVTWHDGHISTGVLRSGFDDLVLPGSAGGEPRLPVLLRYIALGVEHILLGPDHLLFVLGLVLLVANLHDLLWTITAFTAAHSMTLALAVLGILRLPSPPVEATIALSLVLVAFELTRPPEVHSLARRKPWLVAFAFGLLHGLGFAGALRDVGLPPDRVPLALVGFNVGVELGQLAFVVVLLPIRTLLQRAPRWVRLVPAYAIGSLAVAWMCERVAVFWG